MSDENKKLNEKLELHDKQLEQTGVVVTDLVIRVTALERVLLGQKIISNEKYAEEIKNVSSELTKLMSQLFEINNREKNEN